MSVSASWSTGTSHKTPRSERKCERCYTARATINTAGVTCKECFLFLTKRRFQETITSSCNLDKYDRVIIAYNGSISTAALLNLLQPSLLLEKLPLLPSQASSLPSSTHPPSINGSSDEDAFNALLKSDSLVNTSPELLYNSDFPFVDPIPFPQYSTPSLPEPYASILNKRPPRQFTSPLVAALVRAAKQSLQGMPLRGTAVYVDDRALRQALAPRTGVARGRATTPGGPLFVDVAAVGGASDSDAAGVEDASSARVHEGVREGEDGFPVVRYARVNAHGDTVSSLAPAASHRGNGDIIPVLCVPVESVVPLSMVTPQHVIAALTHASTSTSTTTDASAATSPTPTPSLASISPLQLLLARRAALMDVFTPLTPSQRALLLKALVQRVLAATARALSYATVLTADSANTIATDIVRSLCRGQGASVPACLPTLLRVPVRAYAPRRTADTHADTNTNTTDTHVTFARPFRDLLSKALALYAHLMRCQYRPSTGLCRDRADTYTLCGSFVETVQTQNSGSVFNIVRTSEKLYKESGKGDVNPENKDVPESIAKFMLEDDPEDAPTCGSSGAPAPSASPDAEHHVASTAARGAPSTETSSTTDTDTTSPAIAAGTACRLCCEPVVEVPANSRAQLDLLAAIEDEKRRKAASVAKTSHTDATGGATSVNMPPAAPVSTPGLCEWCQATIGAELWCEDLCRRLCGDSDALHG